jgi:methionine-rich copper-binding protein CopC
MHRTRRSLTAVVAASAVLLALGVASAVAHVTLVSTSPAAKSKLGRAPQSVSLLFSGPIRSGTLKVVGPKGQKVSVGSGARDPRNIDRLLVALRHGLKAGKYTAKGATIAADGHPQTWTFSFTVKK